jgi:DNA processing protein
MALLEDAPPCLMVLGDAALLHKPAIAIVGGRNASANGQKLAEGLAAELASHLVVISGLARGIDAAAHKGALSTGRTVAAIAGGLDVAYPPGHEDLQRKIAETGALVTEAAPGTVPQARHFPRRNRIIAGLSLGVVVVEAAPRSGSLITAGIAQDAGREIFAVPGSPLDPRARGANDLLRQGAILTETAADVLANLPLQPGGSRQPALPLRPAAPAEMAPQDLSSARSSLLALMGPEPTPVDDLLRRCQFSASAVMAALLELELAGTVDALPGNRVALSPSAAS